MKQLVLSLWASVSLLCPLARVHAHASPVLYEPAASSVVQEAPTAIRIRFTERIEPEVSSITVFDPTGSDVTAGEAVRDPQDPYLLTAPVRGTMSGTYAVSWQVVSADDGHFTKGAFVYSIGQASEQISGQDSFQLVHRSPVPEAIAIMIELLGFSLWLGLIAFWFLASKDKALLPAQEQHTRLFFLSLTGSVLIVLGALAALCLQAARMWTGDMHWVTAVSLAGRTTAGTYVLLRAAVGIVLLSLALVREQRWQRRDVWIALVLCCVFAVLRARVSHAAASPILPVFSVLVNAVHLLAKELWMGMLIVFVFLLLPPRQASLSLLAISARVSTLLAIAFGVGALTGTYIVWLHLKEFSNLLNTHWGWLSLGLTGYAAVLLLLRLYQQCVVLPEARNRSLPTESTQTVQYAWMALVSEMWLGIAVLFFSSQLIITTPPLAEGHPVEHVRESQGVRLVLGPDPYETEQMRLVLEREKEPLSPKAVVITATNAEQGIGPIVVTAVERFVGGYVFPASTLNPPGTWTIEVTAQQQDTYDATASFTVRIPSDLTQQATSGFIRSYDVVWIGGALFFAIVAMALFFYARRIQKAFDQSASVTVLLPDWRDMAFSSILLLTMMTSAGLLLSSHGHGSFKKACVQSGGYWHEHVPMRAGKVTSPVSVMGCMMGMGQGQFHFADAREFAYFLRPAAATVKLLTDPATVRAGEEVALDFLISHPAGGIPESLTPVHDQLMHVMILGQDLHAFRHLHPSDAPATDGTWIHLQEHGFFTMHVVFPQAGRYMIATDFAIRSHAFAEQFVIDVAGSPSLPDPDTRTVLASETGSYTARLDVPAFLRIGDPQLLRFSLTESGKNVMDLQPYLAAPLHLAIASANLRTFDHAHGELPQSLWQRFLQPRSSSTPHAHVLLPETFGPIIEAPVVFPHAGPYVLFAQTKHKGNILTFRFLVDVP